MAEEGRPDLLRMVDEYRSILEEIGRLKMRGAGLGSEARRRREGPGEAGDEPEGIEGLEREIAELRERIAARQREIEGLGGRG